MYEFKQLVRGKRRSLNCRGSESIWSEDRKRKIGDRCPNSTVEKTLNPDPLVKYFVIRSGRHKDSSIIMCEACFNQFVEDFNTAADEFRKFIK